MRTPRPATIQAEYWLRRWAQGTTKFIDKKDVRALLVELRRLRNHGIPCGHADEVYCCWCKDRKGGCAACSVRSKYGRDVIPSYMWLSEVNK